VTERWVREFFQNPARHLENLLGMDPSCSASKSCLTVADELLDQRRAEWRESGQRGKILVGLTYVLGGKIWRRRDDEQANGAHGALARCTGRPIGPSRSL